MNFELLNQKMRKYEQSLDVKIPPELYLAVRIDGRSFTRLTKEQCPMEAPFDMRFRDCMVGTVKYLMDCGFRVVYGYTESDEISLLFHPTECSFGRKTRKFNSILAGEASAAFTYLLGHPGAFDCRLVPLPTVEAVKDYFCWRQEDAHRNARNAHCYWALRKEGHSPKECAGQLEGQSVEFKEALLLERGIRFQELPSWQKRGIGIWWKWTEKPGTDPRTGEHIMARRRILHEEYELPIGEAYSALVESLLMETVCSWVY